MRDVATEGVVILPNGEDEKRAGAVCCVFVVFSELIDGACSQADGGCGIWLCTRNRHLS